MKSLSNARSRKWTVLFPATFCVGLVFGCSGSNASPSPSESASSDVAQGFDALSGKIENCGQNFGSCLESARGDQTKNKACEGGFQTCETDARAAEEALAKAIQGCLSTARECVRSPHDGGPKACGDELHECIAQNVPTPTIPDGGGFKPPHFPIPDGGFKPPGGGFKPPHFPIPDGGFPGTKPPHLPPGLPSGFPPLPSGFPTPPKPPSPPPCLEALATCVQGGGQPLDCIHQSEQCILKGMNGFGDAGLPKFPGFPHP